MSYRKSAATLVTGWLATCRRVLSMIGMLILGCLILFTSQGCAVGQTIKPTLAAEYGAGIKVTAYRRNAYQHNAVVLRVPTSEHRFIEVRGGLINGGHITSLAYGLTHQLDAKWSVNASIGGAYVNRVPAELTGNAQFLVSLGTEFQITKEVILIWSARHLSNGSKIFNHGRVPNNGVEHVFIGLGYRF